MDGEKSQPQELLEEVIGITHHNEDEKFPSIAEQEEYWRKKDLEENRAEVEPDKNECLTCNRKFKSPQALRMHVARVHTKTIQVKGQGQPKPKRIIPEDIWGIKPQRKWSLARRRAYNRKKREQQKMDMLAVSTGPLPSPWIETPPPQEEPVVMIRFCPHCGKSVERFLS